MILEECRLRIEKEISSIEVKQPVELYEPIKYIMELGGKRLRPTLCLLSYNLFKPDWEEILAPAVGLEVFHNFTLMHDDIMDNAPLRRGSQTIHEKWNHNIGILSGDVMLVKAYELMCKVNEKLLLKVLTAFNQCATHVCEGQQMDMNFENRNHVSEQEYLTMIHRKTAALLGFSMELGGILAGQEEKTVKHLYSFASNLGMAFQLKDDLLDVYGDNKFGKQIGGDIISNKKTFLLISALESVKGSDKANLENWLDKKEFDHEQKINEIITIYNNHNIREITEKKISEYMSLADETLTTLRVNSNGLNELKSYTEKLKHREQ